MSRSSLLCSYLLRSHVLELVAKINIDESWRETTIDVRSHDDKWNKRGRRPIHPFLPSCGRDAFERVFPLLSPVVRQNAGLLKFQQLKTNLWLLFGLWVCLDENAIGPTCRWITVCFAEKFLLFLLTIFSLSHHGYIRLLHYRYSYRIRARTFERLWRKNE